MNHSMAPSAAQQSSSPNIQPPLRKSGLLRRITRVFALNVPKWTLRILFRVYEALATRSRLPDSPLPPLRAICGRFQVPPVPAAALTG
jgi:hypothetical protein